jgi:hypothetical protein
MRNGSRRCRTPCLRWTTCAFHCTDGAPPVAQIFSRSHMCPVTRLSLQYMKYKGLQEVAAERDLVSL